MICGKVVNDQKHIAELGRLPFHFILLLSCPLTTDGLCCTYIRGGLVSALPSFTLSFSFFLLLILRYLLTTCHVPETLIGQELDDEDTCLRRCVQSTGQR